MNNRILVVEDDPLVAIMLEGYLDALDVQIAGYAENVAGALAHIRETRFDAAILDLHLADGETSEAVARALKEANLPFLVATGYTVSDVAAFDGAPILMKPFSLTSLETTLQQLNILACGTATRA